MSENLFLSAEQLKTVVAAQDVATLAISEAEAAQAIAQREIARALVAVGQPVKLSAICFACGCVYRRSEGGNPCPSCTGPKKKKE